MPYSNWTRHNSLSIPQTPYQTLIIPCPIFDPIYQVILLENSNEWNLSLAKEASAEREREREREASIEKKRGETLVEKFHIFRKKKSGWNLHVVGRDSIKRKKERKKGDHNLL
jgi:hypothetical protein